MSPSSHVGLGFVLGCLFTLSIFKEFWLGYIGVTVLYLVLLLVVEERARIQAHDRAG